MKFKPGTFFTVPNKEILAGLPPQAQVLFFWICAHSNKEGVCFPSASLLAKECGVSRRTIFNHLPTLESCGLISRSERFSKSGKSSNYYQIIPVDIDKPSDQIVKEMHGGSETDSLSLVSQMPSNYIQYNKNQLIFSGGAGGELGKEDIPVVVKPYSQSEALAELSRRPSPIHKIAGLLMSLKGSVYSNQKQFNAAFGRALKPAKQLEGYSSGEITSAIAATQEQAAKLGFDWQFETVVKNIERVANKNSTASPDITRARILQDLVDNKIT